MKVKFNRLRLIAALKKSKEQALDLFKKDTREYHAQVEKAKKQHIANVRSYLKELENSNGHKPETYRIGERLLKDAEYPSDPRKPRLDNVVRDSWNLQSVI